MAFSFYYYLSMAEVPLLSPGREFLEKALIRLQSLIHEGVGLGCYKPVRDSKALAKNIYALILGHWMMNGIMKTERHKLTVELDSIKRQLDVLIATDAKT